MVKQINPGLARIWHSANTRQYGTHNPTLIQIDSEAEHRAVDLLETGVTNAQFESLGKIAKIKDFELDSLLARLIPVMANTSSFLPTMDAIEVEKRFAEITNLFLLGFADPAQVMANRMTAKVFVSSIGRSGLLACRALYTAGIGTILTFDAKRVNVADTSEIGYSKQLLGLTRLDALKQTLGKTRAEIQLHSRITAALDSISAAVILSNDAVDPGLYQPWMSREIPHLAICFTETGAEISQLVLPGKSSCLACHEIHRMDNDPDWLRTVTQLAQLDRDLADAATLLVSTGLAVKRILEVIDGVAEPSEIQYRYDRKSSTLSQATLTAPNCGCR